MHNDHELVQSHEQRFGKLHRKTGLTRFKKWEKHGDHEAVEPWPHGKSLVHSSQCLGIKVSEHGMIQTFEGPLAVCPGDYIATDPENTDSHWPVKSNYYAKNMEEVSP